MKTLIVIPTYNEKENIEQIITQVLEFNPTVEILVVDDNSPDGTQDIVQKLIQQNHQIHLLPRASKQGLGKAYLAGFTWGIEKQFEIIVEMDADFSHRPIDLVQILQAMPERDFAVGSRYVAGGETVNWGILRKIISRGGGIYSRIILGYPLRDWTGGFNAWKINTLIGIGLDQVKSEGYSFQIELKYRAMKAGFQGIEVPIVFEDRRVGQSKMSFRIVLEAFYRVWLLRF